ncbi:Transposase [Ruegeria denitrificans]|uniref:Transposase n=1 Tax=Ruegeria denitrificans TaxID=1715692 RepID=A0A0P1I2S7_9RHOB|nr:phage terminase large subunit [Ruegeria denitrificans]CUJ87239.1 Transposase [Ruegeria denitrificans]
MPPIDIVRALCASNLMAFVEAAFGILQPDAKFHAARYLRALCYQLERLERGEIRRLLIILPPRHLKSFCASVVFPVWVQGRNPSTKVITASYGASLAEDFSWQSRRLMDHDLTCAIFPNLEIDKKKATVSDLRTTLGGQRIATSVGGPMTGKGGKLFIVDDPSKAEDVFSEAHREKVWEWFSGSALMRLDQRKEARVAVVAQRLHPDDLPGRLIQTGLWEVLVLPVIEVRERKVAMPDGLVWTRRKGDILLPQHIDLEELNALRLEIGGTKFEAQYQQSPVPAGGNIVKPEWFATIPPSLRSSDYEAIIQSWDTASVPGESNDHSVCTTWGLIGNYIDLLDVHRQQYLQPDLLSEATKLRKKWRPNLLVVETVGAGCGVYDHLRRQAKKGVRSHTPKLSKDERMSIQSPKIEQGQVRLPASAPWKEVFLAEVAAFPNGKHDDQVDSMSQALRALDHTLHELRHCSRYKGRLGRVL